MKVAVRADASQAVGSGHVMRCLALADELRTAGHEVIFITHDAPGNLDELITTTWGFEVRSLALWIPHSKLRTGSPEEQAIDAEGTIAALRAERVDWLVVDHYSLDATWERLLQPHVRHMLVIDDLGNRDHDCDILVDQNSLPAHRYRDQVPERCELLTGRCFALLRNEFRGVTREPVKGGGLGRILVSFGGTDPKDQAWRTLDALRTLDFETAIDVITGRDHPRLSQLQELVAGWPALEVHEHVTEMMPLLAQADLAIGAGGVSALERLCAGVPSIVVTTADNQIEVTEALAREGLVYYLGAAGQVANQDIVDAVRALENPYLRYAMARRGTLEVDGNGTLRVLRAMQRHEPIQIREAVEGDCKLTFRWRNHPATRQYIFNAQELSWEEHREWFLSAILNPRRHLLIGEIDGRPIGVVRYDISHEGRQAKVSIYLDPALRGRGYGAPLLIAGDEWLRNREANVGKIVSHILSGNAASEHVFRRGGYRDYYNTFVKGLR